MRHFRNDTELFMRRQKEGGAQGSRAASFRAEIPGRQQRGKATEKQAPPVRLTDIGLEFSRRGKRKNGGIYSRKKFGLFRTLLYVILIKSRAAGQTRSVLFILVSSIPRKGVRRSGGRPFILQVTAADAQSSTAERGSRHDRPGHAPARQQACSAELHNKETRHTGHKTKELPHSRSSAARNPAFRQRGGGTPSHSGK